jgi:pantoate--beta-alanine ligase
LPHQSSVLKIIQTIADLDKALAPYRISGKKIGFVPTMGALHKGHISLIDFSRKECDVTVCSIFVNPTQFNDPKDLERYPRPMEEDAKMLREAGCDILFAPSVIEMYPTGDFSLLKEDFGNMDKVMEGKSRPGHFAGMITIVSKLFNAVKPTIAYFGSKDFQQYTLVSYFVKKHDLPITIKPCPIVREPDGLAMSSRNRLLSAEERKHAVLIPQTLFKVKEMWGKKSVTELKEFVQNEFAKNGFLKLDYFEISYADTLEPVQNTHLQTLRSGQAQPPSLLIERGKPKAGVSIVACIAAFDGKIRLIDNIILA